MIILIMFKSNFNYEYT